MGFRTVNTNTINFEDTFFLENIIYNELLSRGYNVFTGKTYKGEIDFVAIKDGKKCFLLVSYLLASAETIKREFGAYDKITDASPKYVLSLDKIDMSQNGIIHMNILDFLLNKKRFNSHIKVKKGPTELTLCQTFLLWTCGGVEYLVILPEALY